MPRTIRYSLLCSSILMVCCLLLLNRSYASTHQDIAREDTVNKKKLNRLIFISSAAYGAALVGLNQVWYSDHERESFHFFNDNDEWKQLDKVGHSYNAFQISKIGIQALRGTGLEKRKSYIWGGMLGVIILTPIEILDGFSSEYGASWGDVIANISGSALGAGQYALWDEVKVHLKYSFYPDQIAGARPELLGEGLHEEIIKNYNGMTFWLSFDVYKFTRKESKFPKWLNLAIGYGGAEMISANDSFSKRLGYDPYRQYYLSIDFDLSHINTNNKILKTLLDVVNAIHLPAPALEYNRRNGLKFHPFYF